MTERTVTKQQIAEAIDKTFLDPQYLHLKPFFDELFPELPKVGELILVWDNLINKDEWNKFIKFDELGQVIVQDRYGNEDFWDNYRRQTPQERGE